MYSAVTLLPQEGVGFVILINTNAGDARTVLNQVLVKQFTAPEQQRTVAYYAGLLDRDAHAARVERPVARSEEHTSELQSLMRISYAVFCLKKKKNQTYTHT